MTRHLHAIELACTQAGICVTGVAVVGVLAG